MFDGMGGEAAGELASFTAAEKMRELSGQKTFSEESVKELCMGPEPFCHRSC